MRCKVCGSSAVKRRPLTWLWLCVYHEAVCRPHLQDPCRICDGGEQ